VVSRARQSLVGESMHTTVGTIDDVFTPKVVGSKMMIEKRVRNKNKNAK
jgi:hypothetical protein